jgi:hypothetical protein
MPESMDPVQLLNRPDVQVIQEGERYYRIRVGAVELTYDATCGHGAWYLYLPQHEQRVPPVRTQEHDAGPGVGFMINIDHDQKGKAFGIAIV